MNAIRTQTMIRDADVVVVRFGDKYRQWNAAFDAGYAAALGKPIVTLHDEESTTRSRRSTAPLWPQRAARAGRRRASLRDRGKAPGLSRRVGMSAEANRALIERFYAAFGGATAPR